MTQPTQRPGPDEGAARETFANIAAHALGGAAHSFVTALELLADERVAGALNPKQRKLLNNVRISAKQLYQLSDDIALLTNAAVGQLQLNYELLTVTTLVRLSVKQAQQPHAPNPPRDFELRISKVAPALSGDALLLRRALAAIIENALRFSPAGSPIIVETRKHYDRLSFTVTDVGNGVPVDQMVSIFDPLVSAQRPLQTVGVGLGLGVGLAVARAICVAHGGRITFSHGRPHGAICTVDLPISEPNAPAVSR